MQNFSLLGVPSSAGAHMPGQELAPSALRDAGLLNILRDSGGNIVDAGDLPVVRHQPDQNSRTAQNHIAVLAVAETVANRVESILVDQRKPLVIGGDCTISLGVVTAFLRQEIDLGVVYLDAHFDMNAPINSASGAMDSMGMAHMLGAAGVVENIAHMAPRYPMLEAEKVVFFGYDDRELNEPEQTALQTRNLMAYEASLVNQDAQKQAALALAEIEAASEQFFVHFDVDAVDFVELPLANMATINRGLTVASAFASIQVFAASPKFAGLVVSEINPNHADKEGKVLSLFCELLSDALIPGHIEHLKSA